MWTLENNEPDNARHDEDIYGDLYTDDGAGEGVLHLEAAEVCFTAL